MSDVCSVCGLPRDLCVCETISAQQLRIKVRMEVRRWGKPATVIEGIDPKSHNLEKIAKELKARLACGGTVKNGAIILQGDHRDKIVEHLEKLGFYRDTIDVV